MAKGSRRSQRTAEALAALRSDDAPVLRPPSGERTEDGYVVRSVGVSDKVFRCPGCSQEVVAVPHVVAWPEHDVEQRRHWHTPCWTRRAQRRPR